MQDRGHLTCAEGVGKAGSSGRVGGTAERALELGLGTVSEVWATNVEEEQRAGQKGQNQKH